MRLIAIFLAAGSLHACGPAGPSSAEYASLFAERFCAKSSECCTFSGGEPNAMCRSVVAAETQADVDAALAAGAVFDSAAAADCLERWRTAPCDLDAVAVSELLRACDVWDGTVAPGGPCAIAAECQESAEQNAGCIGGRCVAVTLLPVGSTCAEASTTLQCSPLVSSCDPASSTCVALPAAGEPCTSECRAGATCGMEDVCRALTAGGQACVTGSDCASDVCAAGRCVSFIAGDTEHCTLP